MYGFARSSRRPFKMSWVRVAIPARQSVSSAMMAMTSPVHPEWPGLAPFRGRREINLTKSLLGGTGVARPVEGGDMVIAGPSGWSAMMSGRDLLVGALTPSWKKALAARPT